MGPRQRRSLSLLTGVAITVCLVFARTSLAGGGPFGIDYRVSRSDTGVWNRGVQVGLEDAVVGVDLAGALWFGNDDPMGHTFWQATDSLALSAVAATALKVVFSRARPDSGQNSNAWFRGHGNASFPSGEVTEQASFVTPFIVDYGRSHPWVWALEILPAYDAIARVKSQAHWQSDVIAGWALGTGFGYWTATWKTPLLVRVLPGGVTIGLSRRF